MVISASSSPRGAERDTRGRLLIVSNRLPISIRRRGSVVRVEQSSGGLATGLRRPHERSFGYWIGWPGDLHDLDDAELLDARRRLSELRTIPVMLEPGQSTVFYEETSNAILWPLCHERLDRLPLELGSGWDVYESVNARFADVVAEVWRPGDLIWIHDYQLMRMPKLLRQRLPDARIGFFLHIPFPHPDMFLVLPQREWLVEGLLGADLIGFHTRGYRENFAGVLRRQLRVDIDVDEHVRIGGRGVRLGVFAMGVDAHDIGQRARGDRVAERQTAHRAHHGRLLLGIDRLDYSKGLQRRLAAFERLLSERADLRGDVRLVQVAVPSRGGVAAYRSFRRELEQMVGRINGRFATPTWTPIQYLHRSIDEEELLALYRAADVMIVTPLRDGMNLVSKEFVAARSDEDGVLVLSEFAGAADELAEALIVNPYDIDGVADALSRALAMDATERARRMRALREKVIRNDVHAWAQGFLDALASPSARKPSPRGAAATITGPSTS